jgi:hypothetical protein
MQVYFTKDFIQKLAYLVDIFENVSYLCKWI